MLRHTYYIVCTIIVMFITISSGEGQSLDIGCGFDVVQHQLLATDTVYCARQAAYERKMAAYQQDVQLRNAPTYTIPVVVHVMHLPGDNTVGSGSNISDAQILSGIQHLNDAYRNINA